MTPTPNPKDTFQRQLENLHWYPVLVKSTLQFSCFCGTHSTQLWKRNGFQYSWDSSKWSILSHCHGTWDSHRSCSPWALGAFGLHTGSTATGYLESLFFKFLHSGLVIAFASRLTVGDNRSRPSCSCGCHHNSIGVSGGGPGKASAVAGAVVKGTAVVGPAVFCSGKAGELEAGWCKLLLPECKCWESVKVLYLSMKFSTVEEDTLFAKCFKPVGGSHCSKVLVDLKGIFG